MVTFAVLTSLIVMQKKLLVITVPNLVIVVWDVPSNAGKRVSQQPRPYATNVVKKVILHGAAQTALSLVGLKVSCQRIVVKRTDGKMILALDQLLMILTKEKAPYLRIDGTHLVVNPESGVVGFLRTMAICHIRSTNPMGGPLHLLLRSHTVITNSFLMTIQLLSLQDGKGKATHRIAQNIHQMLEIIAQDFPTIPIFVSRKVRLERTFGFVIPLTIDLLGMKSACKDHFPRRVVPVSPFSRIVYVLCSDPSMLGVALCDSHSLLVLLETKHVTLQR